MEFWGSRWDGRADGTVLLRARRVATCMVRQAEDGIIWAGGGWSEALADGCVGMEMASGLGERLGASEPIVSA